MQQQQQHDFLHRSSSDDSTSRVDSHLLEKDILSFPQRDSFWRRQYWAIFAHFMIFCLYLVTVSLLVVENWRLRDLLRPSLLESPANEAVKWEVQEWHAGDGLREPYVGEPRPELEEAWKGLLGSTFTPITQKHRGSYRHYFDFVLLVCRYERSTLPRRHQSLQSRRKRHRITRRIRLSRNVECLS